MKKLIFLIYYFLFFSSYFQNDSEEEFLLKKEIFKQPDPIIDITKDESFLKYQEKAVKRMKRLTFKFNLDHDEDEVIGYIPKNRKMSTILQSEPKLESSRILEIWKKKNKYRKKKQKKSYKKKIWKNKNKKFRNLKISFKKKKKPKKKS